MNIDRHHSFANALAIKDKLLCETVHHSDSVPNHRARLHMIQNTSWGPIYSFAKAVMVHITCLETKVYTYSTGHYYNVARQTHTRTYVRTMLERRDVVTTDKTHMMTGLRENTETVHTTLVQ